MSKLIAYASKVGMSEIEFRKEVRKLYAAIVSASLEDLPGAKIRQEVKFEDDTCTLIIECYREAPKHENASVELTGESAIGCAVGGAEE